MSRRNLDSKRDARNHLQQHRAQEQARVRARRAVAVAVSALSVLVITTAIGTTWQTAIDGVAR